MRPTRPSQKPTSHLKPLVRLCQLALASCGALGAPHILAADITWTGAGGTTNWSEGANWLGGVAPTATDVAVFNSVVLIQPTSDISRQIDLLRFDSGATATMLVNVNDYLSLESGITNGSAVTQILAVTSGTGELRFGTGTVTGDVLIANHGLTWFGDTSSAGSLDMINNQAGTGAVVRFMAFSTGGDVIINNRADGVVVFQDNANAENLWITNAAAGSLLFADNASAGFAKIDNDGTVRFSNSSTAGGVITSSLTGNVEFLDASSAGNAIIRSEGSVLFDTDASAGNAILSVNNGTLTFRGNASASNGVINNHGTTLFEGSSNAGSGIINNNDTLTFDDTASAGSAMILTRTGGTTTFAADATGGTSQLIIEVAGTVDVSTHNSYVAVGSLEGAGTILLGSKGLQTGHLNTDRTLSSVIADGGAGGYFGKAGTGTLTLTGNSTYTGDTWVDGGRLIVDGSLISSVLVSSASAILSGSGTVGGIITTGVVAPGNSIGTLSVTGNYQAMPLATYEVEIDAAGNSDLLDITGTATLDGQVRVLAEAGTYAASTTYTILNAAGGIISSYAGVTSNLAFLDPSLSYGLNNVYLTMTRNSVTLGGIALTRNQREVSTMLDTGAGAPPAGLAGVYGAIVGASAEQARGYYDELSGDALTAFPTVALDDANRFSGKLRQRALGLGGPSALTGLEMNEPMQVAFAGTNLAQLVSTSNNSSNTSTTRAPGEWASWISVGGAFNRADDDSNGPGFSADSTGIELGLETQLPQGMLVGGALGYTYTSVDVNDHRETDGKINTWHAGLYAGYDDGRWFASGSLAYADHNIDSTRDLTVGGASQARADIDSNTVSLWTEAGLHLGTEKLALDPSVSLRIARTHMSGFSESGAPAALDVSSENIDSQRLGLGVRLAAVTQQGSAQLRPSVSVRYERDLGDRLASLDAHLDGLDTFSARGAQLGRNILTVGLALEANIKRNLLVYGSVDAAWRNNQNMQALQAGLKYIW